MNMKKNYEILAPAGNFESLQAAVQNGADAVYLSGKEFGARKFANNFSNDELIQAIRYCHIRGVEVYVTVNTLVLNNEFERLRRYVDFLYTAGVDAVIVQDIGVLSYIRKTYSDLEIHCSTQMSAQTVEDIRYLGSLGADRVVLGREMTVEDIRRAKRETNVQLEVFIHGSLCISVSGQCLMSSMIGGRSGNRGSCAQPCRQMYTLVNLDTKEQHQSKLGHYLLSPKDLSTLPEIMTVIEAGAFSLKIEGRMKSPEYVATVVGTYKQMIESAYSQQVIDVESLERNLRIFNRGFTRGHLFGDAGSKLMSMKSPGNQGYYLGQVVNYDKKTKTLSIALEADLNHNDEFQIRRIDQSIGGRVEKLIHQGKLVKNCPKGEVCQVNFKHFCKPGEEVYKTFDEEFVKVQRQSYGKEQLEIPVEFEVRIERDKAISGTLTDGRYTVSEVADLIPQAAIKKALSEEEVGNQLAKLGGTPYSLKEVTVSLDHGLSVPMRELNNLRRNLVEKLNDIRADKYTRQSMLKEKGYFYFEDAKEQKKIELTFAISNLSQLQPLLALDCTIYYKDLDTLATAVEQAERANFNGKLIPEIYKSIPDAQLLRYRQLVHELGLDTVLIQGYGHINLFQGFNLIADYNLNIVNDFSYNFYLKHGFTRIGLSPELNLTQISKLKSEPGKTEILGYGYLPVMSMKHCVISTTLGENKNCSFCHENAYAIVDKKNECFKIMKRYRCGTEILNSRKLLLLNYMAKLQDAGVGYFRLNFTDESPDELRKIVELHREYIGTGFKRIDHIAIERIKSTGTSTGHINRGIE